MKKTVLLALIAFVAFTPGILSAKIIRTVEKTFAVQPGGTLTVLTQGGDVSIMTADVDEVRVVARQSIRAGSDQQADEILEKLALNIDQTGNDVRAEAKYEGERPKLRSWSWPPVSVDFVVTVPTRFNADVRTSGGDIVAESIAGNVKLHTSGGDIALEKVDGEIDAHTSGGDITLREGTARAALHTSGGDIRIDKAVGPVEAGTSGGDIMISSVSKLVRAHTSGGDVHAVIERPLEADCSLSTSGGDVSVKFSKSAGFTLDASTSGGDVDATGLTIKIEKGGVGKSRLKGEVNGGGPLLHLRSSGGDISLRSD